MTLILKKVKTKKSQWTESLKLKIKNNFFFIPAPSIKNN